MLLEFRCENFRSFREEACISMLPVNAYKEHSDNLIPVHVPGSNAEGVLSAAVLYGTNASGKTNLLRAVDFARGLIVGVIHPGHLQKRNNFVGASHSSLLERDTSMILPSMKGASLRKSCGSGQRRSASSSEGFVSIMGSMRSSRAQSIRV